MRNILLLLLLSLPFYGGAQVVDADALLDKAVAAMKADAPLQMDYSYTVYDDDNTVVLHDKGVMRLDGNRYSVVMDKMGVWCDGETQWSYMLDIDEIYITDSSSEEAQNLSPLFIMENYRKGCVKTVEKKNGLVVVSLQTPLGSDIEKIQLHINAETFRLEAMDILMPGQGRVEVLLDKYQIKCNFASGVYQCPVEELNASEVIDMR